MVLGRVMCPAKYTVLPFCPAKYQIFKVRGDDSPTYSP